MYPSNNNSCNYSPISSTALFHSNNNNIPSSPNSLQYEQELFHYFQDHFLQQQPPQQQQFLNTSMAEEYSNKDAAISSNKVRVFKKRSKKDRHSKINTARGPRDRRMRLSLDVARKFFSLQDLLGFDKASKTVEWLLTQSKSAVDELYKENCSTPATAANNIGAICASSTSECEVISGIIDESATTNDIPKPKPNQNQQPNSSANKEKKKVARRATFHPVVAKESRNEARARARERTKIKRNQLIGESVEVTDDLKRLGSWSPFEESGINHQEKQNVNVDGTNLGVNGNWSPFTIFNYHEHQFTNFVQFPGKSLWES